MNECLVTTLKGTVNNDTLERLGEFRVHVSADEGPVCIEVEAASGKTLHVTTSDGGAHITAPTVGSSIDVSGFTVLRAEAGNYDLCITSKYDIIHIGNGSAEYNDDMDLDKLRFNDELSLHFIHHANHYDINFTPSLFTNFKAIGFTGYNDGYEWYDINDILSHNPNMEVCSIGGHITLNMDTILSVKPANCVLSNDWNKQGTWLPLNQVKELNLSRAFGDVVAFINNTCDNSVLRKAAVGEAYNYMTSPGVVRGDLSLLPSNLQYFGVGQSSIIHSQFTWKNTRPAGSQAFCLKGSINLGDDINAAIKNIATLDFTNPYSQYDKIIQVEGNYDSSDADAEAAIVTIKAAGWTVLINGVQK